MLITLTDVFTIILNLRILTFFLTEIYSNAMNIWTLAKELDEETMCGLENTLRILNVETG